MRHSRSQRVLLRMPDRSEPGAALECQLDLDRDPLVVGRALGTREQAILDPLLDFLARRLFGPDRLRLLHDELAQSLDACGAQT